MESAALIAPPDEVFSGILFVAMPLILLAYAWRYHPISIPMVSHLLSLCGLSVLTILP